MVGDIIQSAMARKMIGPTALARKAKVSRAALYLLINNKTRQPQLATAARLAKVLSLNIDDLNLSGTSKSV